MYLWIKKEIDMQEQWKEIDGYEGRYLISSFGRVMSNRIGNKEVPFFVKNNVLDSDGYSMVQLSLRGVRKMHKVHRLVAIHFIPNPLNKPTVNHIDGVKGNNKLDNLEWNTVSENIKHAFKNKLKKVDGEFAPSAKLDNIKVLTIKTLLLAGMSQRKIAKIYKVHFNTISQIYLGKTWKSLL